MDNIIHTGQIRLRATGEGNLDLRLIGLYEDINTDNPPTQILKVIPMQTGASRFPHVLSNFNQQYTQVEFSVNEIDEWFLINKIVIYIRALWTGYPG